MVKDGADIQAYTAQIEVDAAHQVIIAQGVSGYFSQHNAEHLQQRNLDPYIAVGREGTAAALPTQASTPAQRLKASMGENLSKGKGKIVYSRRFSQRGHGKVRCEWAFVCRTHNLLKLFRHLAGGSQTARRSFTTWTG